MAIHIAPIRNTPHTTPPVPARTAATAVNSRASRSVGLPEVTAQRNSRTISTNSAASTPSAAQAPASDDPMANFKALFSGTSSNAPVQSTPTPAPQPAPTAKSAFGSNPWVANPTGVAADGTTYGYNAQYFATPQTASAVAQMLGGTVVQVNEFTNAPGTTFMQQQPNEMVKLKSGALINPGLVAGFYTHGYPQSMVDQMITNEVANVNATT